MSNYKGFSSVQLNRPKRSAFNLSHEKRLTCDAGNLVPVLVQECVPSDSFRISTELLLRLAPLLAPIYDAIYVYVHFFFVPMRLLYADWEKFITGGRLGVGIDPVNAPIPPYFDIGEVMTSYYQLLNDGSLADYMEIPNFNVIDSSPGAYSGKFCDVAPLLGYQLCWFEFYRDRNFVSDDTALGYAMPVPSGKVSAADAADMLKMRVRNYSHDYFTSALPFTQRGEEVMLPVQLSGLAPIVGRQNDGSIESWEIQAQVQPGGGAVELDVERHADAPNTHDLWADLNDAVGDGNLNTSINDFRSAYALQVWLERNAVGGSRYTESTQAHFGVKPQDSRLQRPEYIGGGMIPVKITEVVSTAWSSSGLDTVPLANMAGHGITYGNTNRANYFCTEHGFILGIMSIMTPRSYYQGLPKMYRRRSFLDYPWPTFARLGEQEIADHELYADPASMTVDSDGEYPSFGYTSRYADWKNKLNTAHGEFRNTLKFWSAVSDFADAPVLGEEFNLYDRETVDRIFAVPEAEGGKFWIYLHNNVHVKRPLPYYGTPNTLGFE